ncbi:MAG: hypothetical protein MI748_18465 [Opitutales bacterium]|nr:hypothetical protein [Opitutales bacterium]
MKKPPDDKLEFFVLLGMRSPERLDALCQLIEYWHFHGEKVLLWHHENEPLPEDHEAFSRLKKKGLEQIAWDWNEDATDFAQPDVTFSGADVVLFLDYGGKQLIDTLEILSKWLPQSPLDLERIITWVHCQNVSENFLIKRWYETCFHFSDAVILDAFKDLPATWLKEYQQHFKTQCYPCIVENTKKGRLKNLQNIVDDQVRRISQAFEFEQIDMNWDFEIETEDGEEDDDDFDDLPPKEAFFERNPDGKRSKIVTDILS